MKGNVSAPSKSVCHNVTGNSTPGPLATSATATATATATGPTIALPIGNANTTASRFNNNTNINSNSKANLLISPQTSNPLQQQHQVSATPIPSPASSNSSNTPHISSSSPSIALPPPPVPNMLQPHSPHQQRFHNRQPSQQPTQQPLMSSPAILQQPEPQLSATLPCHTQIQSQCPHHQSHPHQQTQHPTHSHTHQHHPHGVSHNPHLHGHNHVHGHGHHLHGHHAPSGLSLTPLLLADQIVGKLFRVRTKIGSGSFGEIYHGTHVQTHSNVAIKVERQDSKYPQLLEEYKVYNSIRPAKGFPQVYWYGTFGQLNVLVMDLLGPSLETLYHKCGRKFSIKTVAMLALQLLERIEHQHSHCYLHRDVKPDNFLLGRNADSKLVYVIDMGLAKQYRDPRSMQHIPKKDNKKLIGTPRYASINTHMGLEQCRRDDLESIGYMLLYFALGRLPWQGLKAKTKQEKYDKISERKKSIPIHELCANLPDEFCRYLAYVRSLRFEEEPDYSYLRGLFQQLLDKNGWHDDDPFDWQLLKKDETQQSAHTQAHLQDIQFVVRQMNHTATAQAINPFVRNQCSNNSNNNSMFGGVASPNLSLFKAVPPESNSSTGKASKKKNERQNQRNMQIQLFNLPTQAQSSAPMMNQRMQSNAVSTPMSSSLTSANLPLPLPPSSSSSLPLMLTSGLPPQFQVQFTANANNQPVSQPFVLGRAINNVSMAVPVNHTNNAAATTNQKSIFSPRPNGVAVNGDSNKANSSCVTSSLTPPMLSTAAPSHSPAQHGRQLQGNPINSSQSQQHTLTHSQSHGQDVLFAANDLSSALSVPAVQRATTDVSLACLSDALTTSNCAPPPKSSMHIVGHEDLLHAFESVENERDLLRKRASKYEAMLHGYRFELARMKDHIQKFSDKPYQFFHPLIVSQFGLATHTNTQMSVEADATSALMTANPLFASRAASAATVSLSLDTNEALPSLTCASLAPSSTSAAALKSAFRHTPAASHLSHSSSSRVGSPALALASPSVDSSSSPVQSPPISPNPLQPSSSAAASAAQALSPTTIQPNGSHSPLLSAHSLKRKTPNSSLFADGERSAQLCVSVSANSLKRMRTSLITSAFNGDDEDEQTAGKMLLNESDGDSNVLHHFPDVTATL